MTPISRIMFMLFVLIALATISVSAQSVHISPDDRYEGYKGHAIAWPPSHPDLEACKASEYYEPSATNLARFALNDETVRVQEHDECTWMITTSGWRWVLRRAGTKVAVDKEGRDLYDFGREDGKVCKNPRPVSVPIMPPAPPRVDEPAKVGSDPLPEPRVVVVEFELPPYNPVKLVSMPPPPPLPPDFDYKVELVWDEKGRHWFWKIPGTNCVYTFTHDIKKWKGWSLAEKVGCAGMAVGGYALAGGFSGGGSPLVKFPVRVPSIPPP